VDRLELTGGVNTRRIQKGRLQKDTDAIGEGQAGSEVGVYDAGQKQAYGAVGVN